jgi:hypothetical protein
MKALAESPKSVSNHWTLNLRDIFYDQPSSDKLPASESANPAGKCSEPESSHQPPHRILTEFPTQWVDTFQSKNCRELQKQHFPFPEGEKLSDISLTLSQDDDKNLRREHRFVGALKKQQEILLIRHASTLTSLRYYSQQTGN